MTYETVVAELFSRLPYLEEAYRATNVELLDEPPLPYIVFGDVLMPALATALEQRELAVILRICAFLEDMAEAGEKNSALRTLMQVEVGEWLEICANEEVLSPWLGAKTKRVCNYVPGRATAWREFEAQQKAQSVRARLSSVIRKVLGR